MSAKWPAIPILCAFLLAAMLAGCDNPKSSPAPPGNTPPSVTVTPEGHLPHAQAKLATMKLHLGGQVLETEVCTNNVQRMTGMMFRTNMVDGEAMLFVFPYAHRTSFYMKNTRVPLSAAYIDSEGVIQEIHDLQPGDLQGAEAGSDTIQYVLEVPQGWFKRKNLSRGVVIRTERGSLAKTFFGAK